MVATVGPRLGLGRSLPRRRGVPPRADLRGLAAPRSGLRTGLVIDPGEAAVLAQAYQLVADGGSLIAATRLFTASGLPTRRGGNWTPATHADGAGEPS